MERPFERSELLLGKEAMARLAGAHVAVFGVGGVGGYALEALVRTGVGEITAVDKDTVNLSNLNRQIIATRDTVGLFKVDAAEQRARSINPDVTFHAIRTFYLPENAEEIDLSAFDYVVDAVDTVSAKIELAVRARAAGVPLISSMGAGNKLDPTRFEVADLARTSVCPLARVMRRELKKRGIEHLKVVYSREEPLSPRREETGESAEGAPARRKLSPGSVAFVPSVAGLILAGEVIRDLIRPCFPD
ncbi:MAG: tRNA threonylcarbamoyladenosine dehydratase [Clostridia bacterium]|nr:tRNA threonylcarbamoyladenosine dehydratase [Clostridia bacterium]